jgi:hypothetical protein
MGLFDTVKKDDDFIKYLSGSKNLEEFLWSLNKCGYDFPQIIKYCCDLVTNERKLSRHNKEAVINEIRENLDFYINIYTNLTGINRFQKPKKDEADKDKKPSVYRPIKIDWDSDPDYFLFLCPHCHAEFSIKNKESLLNDLRCPFCKRSVSVHNVIRQGTT